jgi:hypothetical protein
MREAAGRPRGPVRAFFGRRFSRIREINRRYAGRRAKMTPVVKAALFLLRLYLLLLVGILFLKFFTILTGH